MSRMQNRIDVQAEINVCERIRAFDETRLNLELSRAGVDPEGLAQRLDGELGITAHEGTQPPVLAGSCMRPSASSGARAATSVPASTGHSNSPAT